MAELFPHYFVNDGKKIGIRTTDVYEGIDTICGVFRATDAVEDEITEGGDVSELINRGLLFRMNLAYKVDNKRRVIRILVDKDKIGAARTQLKGKTLTYNAGGVGNTEKTKTGKIISAYFPTRTSFR